MANLKSVCAIVLSVLLSNWTHAADISIAYKQIWPDVAPERGRTPVLVEITNKGPNTAGLLRYLNGGRTMAYPVELPRGASKSLTVYCESRGYDSRLELETPLGTVGTQVEIKSLSGGSNRLIGVISATNVGLTTLRKKQDGKNWFDSTVLPEDSPIRSIAYNGMECIVLGRGSERISDASVVALKRYLLKGGILLFSGGASPLTLRDERWSDALPIKIAGTKNLYETSGLATYGSQKIISPISVSIGQLKPGAYILLGSTNDPLVIQNQVGLGRVVVCTFDLYEDPVRTWSGRDTLLRKLLTLQPSGQLIANGIANLPEEGFGGRHPTLGSGTTVDASDLSDPFNVKLAHPGKVVTILLGFFMVCVPINFFVLGRFKRKELAWASLPIISIIFAGAIFSTTGGLYAAKEARATSGLLLVHHAMKESLFVGEQQLFFPKAGKYDLGFTDVEMASGDRNFGMRMGLQRKEIELIDVGQVIAPALDVPNLAFKQYQMIQGKTVDWILAFTTSKQLFWKANGKIQGTIRNESPYAIERAQLWFEGQSYAVQDLNPGQTLQIDIPIKAAGKSSTGRNPSQVPTQCLALEGTVSIPVGSTYGTEVKGRSNVRLLYTWPKENLR